MSFLLLLQQITKSHLAHKSTDLFSYNYGGQKSQISFTGSKHGVGRSIFLLDTLEENPFPCLLQILELHSLADDAFLSVVSPL